MKKLLALLVALLLVGCSSPAEPTETPATTATPVATETPVSTSEPVTTPSIDPNAFVGATDQNGTPNVVVTLKDGAIETLVIDEITTDGLSKKELGAEYAPDALPAGPWMDQVAELEKFIIANGVDAVELDDAGKVTNEDISSHVTIIVSNYVETVKSAVEALSAK